MADESGSPTRHVLIETRDPEVADAQMRALEAAGFRVTRCAGPSHEDRDCPVLQGQDCELVNGADAVVHDLDLGHPVDQAVLRGLKERYPRLPIVVEATTATARTMAEDLDRCVVVVPYSMEHVADAVAGALAG